MAADDKVSCSPATCSVVNGGRGCGSDNTTEAGDTLSTQSPNSPEAPTPTRQLPSLSSLAAESDRPHTSLMPTNSEQSTGRAKCAPLNELSATPATTVCNAAASSRDSEGRNHKMKTDVNRDIELGGVDALDDRSEQHSMYPRYKQNLRKFQRKLNRARRTLSSAPLSTSDSSLSRSNHYHHHHHHVHTTGDTDFRVEAGAPQLIRVAGFRDIFEQYCNHLDQATCQFGVSADDQVDCRCDTLHGTIECDVPRAQSHYLIQSDEDTLVVKARIAEFETPPLEFRYAASKCDGTNVLLKQSAQDDYADSLDDSNAEGLNEKSTTLNDDHHSETLPNFLKLTKQWSAWFKHYYLHLLSFLCRDRSRNKQNCTYSLLHQCIAECIGTMFIVIFGVGSVCSAILLKTNVDLWHIATVWGFGVAFAILISASISGGHLNPAVSLAFAIFRPLDFPISKLLPYWIAQYAGGILGGAFNLMVFGPSFRYYESENDIIRGEESSLITASAFGEYFPAPLGLPPEVVSPSFAMMVEAWGTGILMFVILALTDPRQKIMRNKEILPFYIGFTVAVLITLYAPLTQAGWNPARDFGPRVVAALAGWGRIAIPGPRNGFWVYIVGPKIGAPIGAFLYDFLINPGLLN